MHSLLRRLGVHERDLPDIVQRSLMSLHAHWDEYDPKREIRPWVRIFLHRAASDYRKTPGYRRESLLYDIDAISLLPDAAPNAEAALEIEERRALLMEALDALDSDRRTVLVLAEFEELSAPEIASLLTIPVPTVHSRLRLARADVTHAVRRLIARRSQR
jgi:RNA polymerase sigma-70 factor (ECF subfamily)